MKNLYFILILFVVASGCKKDHKSGTPPPPPPPPATKTYLLQRMTSHALLDTTQHTIYQFSYDDKNRITEALYGNSITLTPANAALVMKYSYDNDGNLIAASRYDNDNTTLLNTSSYTYTADSIKVVNTNASNNVISRFAFALSNSHITEAYFSQTNNYQYEYDENGNETLFTVNSTNGPRNYVYTYGKHKSPFAMVGGKNPQLSFFLIRNGFLFLEDNLGSLSNVNEVTIDGLAGTSSTYNYNSAGFPINTRVTEQNSAYPSYYFYYYIVK